MSDKPSRQEAVEARLAQVLKRSDFPSLAEHIQELMVRTGEEQVSIRQVTNTILKDVGLALRVLRTANSVQYNRSGKPILTVAHAVALMGLEAMRDLAVSLLLFQHFRKGAPGVKHLMMLSLLTANHARATAGQVGYPRCEEAYLCGMFRNLGEVLIACYFPADYAAVLQEMKRMKCSERTACLRVLGFCYEELGQQTSQRWNMPDPVVRSMHPEPPLLRPRAEGELLHALTCFSHDLTGVLHREDPAGVKSRLRRILATHGSLLGLGREQIEQISQSAITETRETFQLLRLPLDDLRLRVQTEEALKSCVEESAEEASAQAMEPVKPDEGLRAARQELVAMIEGGDFDLNALLRQALEAIHRQGPFDRVLFCLVSANHQSIEGRLGVGEGAGELAENFRFPLVRQAGPVAAALLGRKDLFVFDGVYADSDFARRVAKPCYGLFPVVVDNVLVGAIFFDRQSPACALHPDLYEELKRMRDAMGRAIRVMREKRPEVLTS